MGVIYALDGKEVPIGIEWRTGLDAPRSRARTIGACHTDLGVIVLSW